MLRVTAACPESCLVCTQDVTVCQQLTYIVAAPETTRVLILTDGHLSSVESANLTLLVNLALLSLSRNAIYGIQEGSLHALTKLQTLSLSRNRIPSSSLPDHTFSKLRSLQILVLSNNVLRTLRAAWFRNTKALRRLLLDGNQITNLTQSSFRGANLHRLRHLDLSNNFISFIEKDAFRPLPHLQEVDLSRNMLAHMPDAFTPLKQLSVLSLEGNQWSCTCDLYPLARFLRNFMTSPVRILYNTKDLNCQVSPPAVAAAKSMLRLSETNCDSKSHNLTLALKDRRGLLPGQDVALMTVLGFAGVVGLICAGLVIFNWKLQQGRANERTSKNLCCRTLNESPCAHEERNGRAVGCCNCHLTQENETEVMSYVGLRKEIPLRQEKRHQAILASTSTALDTSFRKLKGRDHGPDRACSCLGEALLPAGCLGSSGNKKALHDANLVTRCLKTAEKLSNSKHGEVQAQILLQHGTRKIDMSSSDTFRSRYATSTSALARESLGKHLTDKSWQPPMGKGDNASQPPGQRFFITSPSSKPWEPEECAVGRISRTHRVGYDDHCGLLKQNKPMDFHPNTSFTCKYVSWDEFQDYMKEKKPDHREHVKSEKEQIQINRAIKKFLRSRENKDKSKLSAKIKKAYSTKRIKVHDPDLVGGNRLAMSAKTPVSGRQLESENHHLTSLDLKNCASLEEVKESREWFPGQQLLKKKRLKQSHPSEEEKGRNLRIKSGLHPFGKAKVHPEASPQELPKRHKQTGLPPKKLARTSARKLRAAPLAFVSSQLPARSSHANPTCSKMPLESAPQQTPCQGRNGLHSADSLSVGNLDSVQSDCCPVGHVPNGSSSTVLQPITRFPEQQCSLPLFSPAQIENATQLQIEAMGPSPAHLGNVENRVLSSQHSKGATDHVIMVSTQYIDQDKLKTNELNQFTLSLSDQVDTFSRGYSLGNNQTLQQEEQKLSHEQLGSEEKPLVSKSKILHESVESCIVDGEGTDGGNKIPPCIEDCDSSPTAWTQPHNNLPFVMPHSFPLPKGMELLKEICLPPTRSQALGHLCYSSKGGTGTNSVSLGDNHGEAPGTRAAGKDQKQALDERNANASAVSWETRLGATDERQQKLVVCCPGSDKEIVSIKDLSKVKTIMLQSEADPHTLNRESHCRDPGDNRPDVSAHRDDSGTVGMPGASYHSGELNITHFEAENGVPLIPHRENGTENSAYKPASHPPSTEDSIPPLLEAE
ncbi:leucine-rich repeat-containing protein 53 [Peromyscus californicus insignis]|uniref:leucine-rich repeat-containing protein 53 n=1 Tax=Peromyscus californicus insignis TaxID=564181 RepID=UPI0022A6F452|nr:leucine-rich repeat-containing protein 53 [Peromyscus californicus insignis]